MALNTIYKKELHVKYLAPTCSFAMIFHVLSIAAIVVLPAILAFYTRNLWISEMSYTEQPDVRFNYKLLAFLKDSDGNSHVWSTFPTFNTLAQDLLSVPSVAVIEEDENRDGKVDSLNVTLQFENAGITSAQVLLLFQYTLSGYCDLVMETPLFIQKSVDEQSLLVFGDMSLQQTEVLQPHNPNTQYNTSLILNPDTMQSYDITSILALAASRSLTTKLEEVYTVTLPASSFTASFVISFPKQTVRYEPGFWEALKYAWMQYIALLVIARYVICRVRAFVFENMIVTTLRHDNVKTS